MPDPITIASPHDDVVKVWNYVYAELKAISGSHCRFFERHVDELPSEVADLLAQGEASRAGETVIALMEAAVAKHVMPSAWLAAYREDVAARLGRLITMFAECDRVIDPGTQADFTIVLREAFDAVIGDGARADGQSARQLIREAMYEAHRHREDGEGLKPAA